MNINKKKLIFTVLIYSLFSGFLFGAKHPIEVPTAKSYQLSKLEELESATSWEDRAVNAILILVKTSPQERHNIAQKYADRAFTFFGFVSSRKKNIYNLKKVELGKLNFDKSGIKKRLMSINSAFVKIELLGLPAYVYQSPQGGKPDKDKPFGEIAPFVFLTPSEILELRINVLSDLLSGDAKAKSEKEITELIYKHFKPMAADKAVNNKGVNKTEFKKLLKFRLDVIANNELYTQNRLWFDDYLAAIAKYRLCAVSGLGDKDQPIANPVQSNIQTRSVDYIYNLKTYDKLSDAQIKEDIKVLAGYLKEESWWWSTKKYDDASVMGKIQNLQAALVQKRNMANVAAQRKIQDISTEQRRKILNSLRTLHEGAYNKLSVKFRSEYAINCIKNVLFSAEMITAAVLFGTPITAVLTSAAVALGAASALAPQIKKLAVAQKSLWAAKVASGIPVKGFWNYFFNATETLNTIPEAVNTTAKTLQSKVPEFINTFNNAPLPFSSADVCNVSDVAKTIQAAAPKVSSMISLQAASSLVAMMGLPILLRYSQNALIDMVWNSPNKKKYQQYYAFLELRNSIADFNSGLKRMIAAKPVEAEIAAPAVVSPYTAKPGPQKAPVRAVAPIIPTRSFTIGDVSQQEIAQKQLAAKEQADRLNSSRINFNNTEELKSCIQYFKDYCEAKFNGVGALIILNQCKESIIEYNKSLQACYDAKNIAESILYDLKKMQKLSQKKTPPQAEITSLKDNIIAQTSFMYDKYSKYFDLAQTQIDGFSKAVKKSPIEYDSCILACEGLISALEIRINGCVLAICDKLKNDGQSLTKLRDICKQKELLDFNVAMARHFVPEVVISDDGIQKALIIPAGPEAVNVNYENVFTDKSFNKLYSEKNALIRGQFYGKLKNSPVDWDMYFIHIYLMATKVDAAEVCKDNVKSHVNSIFQSKPNKSVEFEINKFVTTLK